MISLLILHLVFGFILTSYYLIKMDEANNFNFLTIITVLLLSPFISVVFYAQLISAIIIKIFGND